MMTVLFASAISTARGSEVHARLMPLMALVALTPARARLTSDVMGSGPNPRNPVLGGLVVLGLVGITAVRDIHVRGRPHPADRYGGGFVALCMVARAILNRTETWCSVTDSLRTLMH